MEFSGLSEHFYKVGFGKGVGQLDSYLTEDPEDEI